MTDETNVVESNQAPAQSESSAPETFAPAESKASSDSEQATKESVNEERKFSQQDVNAIVGKAKKEAAERALRDAVIKSQLDLIKPIVKLRPLGVVKG